MYFWCIPKYRCTGTFDVTIDGTTHSNIDVHIQERDFLKLINKNGEYSSAEKKGNCYGRPMCRTGTRCSKIKYPNLKLYGHTGITDCGFRPSSTQQVHTFEGYLILDRPCFSKCWVYCSMFDCRDVWFDYWWTQVRKARRTYRTSRIVDPG